MGTADHALHAAESVRALTAAVRDHGHAVATALRQMQQPASLDRLLVDALKRRQLTEFLDALKKVQT